jgi:hypothetical protein
MWGGNGTSVSRVPHGTCGNILANGGIGLKNSRSVFQRTKNYIDIIFGVKSCGIRLPLYFLSLVLALTPSLAGAAQVSLAWAKSTGLDIAGYKMHYGNYSGNYQYTVNVGNSTSCTISGLNEGTTYYFAATAYNSQQNESDFSNEVGYTVQPPLSPDTCSLDSRFQEKTLRSGIEYYTDRTYTLTSVPSEYVGMDLIETPNDDRNLTTANGYLTFELTDAATVYVAYDSRATSLPVWMSGFTNTGDRIYTSLDTQPYLKVYSRSYSAGDCVNLGANKATGFSGNTVSNYIVFYGTGDGPSAKPPPPPPDTCILDSRFQETAIRTGIDYYTDRTYTLTSVPSEYVGMDLIKTPNDDGNLTTTDGYLTFELYSATTVYVAYDSRATSLPVWMSGFTNTGDRIYTSLGTQPYLKVYSRSYSAGACANIGANKAIGFSGSTVSNYIVFYGTGDGSSTNPLPPSSPSTCALDAKFQETIVNNGIEYYTDRSYTIQGGLPDFMVGRSIIKTPNDERLNNASSGYMRFSNPVDWYVYVLFDSRAANVPDWLDRGGWEKKSEYQITTSLNSQPYLQVWKKRFPAGACVDLGGNYGFGSSTENRSNFVVVYGK